MSEHILKVEDLHVEVVGKEILHGVDLAIGTGEVHLLFGPNGSGKSTLMGAIMGLPQYKITGGKIFFKGEDITDMPIEERAKLGLGIAFQRPPVVRGVRLRKMLELMNSSGLNIDELAAEMNLTEHLDRDLNLGFSGGESKRAEILALMIQQPDMLLLDEPESGVDLENIELLARKIGEILGRQHGIMNRLKKRSEKSALILSHTGHILEHLNADKGHVFLNGKAVCTANPLDILETVKAHGYNECVSCLREQGIEVEIHV